VLPVRWRAEPPALDEARAPMLPYAFGRSYGDSCLNDGGLVLDVRRLDRMIAFDEAEGRLRCEAGVTLAEILALVVPRGWFLPVVPGTRWVSIGGAVANDIHGKNHHRAGTFGAHVTALELLRSTGERIVCRPGDDLFHATVGGLGLTGLMLWVEIRLVRIPGPGIAMERIRFGSLDGFFELAADDGRHAYTVAWIDCLARGPRLGRGLYLRGDHAAYDGPVPSPLQPPRVHVPFDAPDALLNGLTLRLFNAAYYRSQRHTTRRATVPYPPFFFPWTTWATGPGSMVGEASCSISAWCPTSPEAVPCGCSSTASAARASPPPLPSSSGLATCRRPVCCPSPGPASRSPSISRCGGAARSRCSTSWTPWCAMRAARSIRPRTRG
jgi:hypothetical protein